MEIFWWCLLVALMLAGLAGTVVPLVPGTILILCGAGVGHFALHLVGWTTLVALTLLMLLAQALDILSGAVGAKWFGATRWAAVGGILGAVIGLFYGLPGLILGPLAGALLGELLGGRGILSAGKAGWGTFLGTTAGLVGKLLIGIIMIGWFVIAAIF